MSETKPRLIPGPDHPITVDKYEQRVVVRAEGTVIATTDQALQLQESTYPAVYYIPLSDVERRVLSPSDVHTYCPYKGEASYFDVAIPDGEALPASVWYYADPYEAVADIEGHVAFYADRFTIETA